MNMQLRTLALLGGLTALFVSFGSLLGPNYAWTFAILAVAMNVGAYFFSDKIVLAMHGAQEVSREELPGLHRMVELLAQKAGIPKPRIFLMQSPQPNAFATGRSPAHGVVVFTTGIINTLSERELRAVAAHELAHIRNRDILITSIAATIASAITYLANMVQWSAMFGGHRDSEGNSPLKAFALALVAPLAALVLQLAVSRSREYLADEGAAEMSGDPEGLALALARISRAAELTPPATSSPAAAALFIVNPFSGVGASVLALFSTHPPIEKRIERLHTLSGRMGWQSPFAQRGAYNFG